MKSSFPFSQVNWTTSIFLVTSLLVALVGTPTYIALCGLDLFQVSLFLFYFVATGMSITLGYHRLFAHRAFKARSPVRLATLVFGACAVENSALDWASDHRAHHKNVDHEDDDPYSISRGFFWAHIGWMCLKLAPSPMDNVADLRKDKLVMWQHRWWLLIAVLVGLVLPAALGFLWAGWTGALGSFLIAGVTRIVVVQHCTFFINSLCHTIGKRPYSEASSARDSAVMALLTFGEGYHNYHHSFQHDYRNGVKRWQFDPTKWSIWCLEKVGLVSDLRRVSAEKILFAEMKQARDRANASLRKLNDFTVPENCPRWQKAWDALDEFSNRFSESYTQLEASVAERAKVSSEVLKRWRHETYEFLSHLSSMSRMAVPTTAHS